MQSEYPVLDILSELKHSLRLQNIVILQAPPGAGKSTVLPLELMNEPWLDGKKIIMLEPRRLAVRSVAQRMSGTMGEEIGTSVGYRVRFENKVSNKTRIEVVTEGILTRMIQSDNALEEVGMIIFDEFHERNLHADLALALSLNVQHLLRNDLKILIMSATLDTIDLSAKLGHVPVIVSQGKQYPVEIMYNQVDDKNSYLHVIVAKAIRKALQEQTGDMLVFLPGVFEIKKTIETLEEANVGAAVCPLYGDLPFDKQQEAIALDRNGRRKIVLATSIAETSLTIEGITTVIDSGYSRTPRFDPRSGLTRLETVRVTKDAADQRAGRAGRLGPGVCYRLWTIGIHAGLIPNRSPEITEADLAPLTLELAQWGIKDVNELTWITQPPAGSLKQASELLEQLEALDENRITAKGKEMAVLPTHPRFAHMLIEAKQKGLESLAADVAAVLEERDPLPKEEGADLSLRVQVLRKWRAGNKVNGSSNVFERIERISKNWRRLFNIPVDNTVVPDDMIGFLIAAAYPERIALQWEPHSEKYKLANGRFAKLPPHDPLTREKWLAVAHLDAGKGEGKIFLAASVHEEDLLALSREQEVIKWDDERNMLVASLNTRVGNLVLKSKPVMPIPEDKRKIVLCDTIRDKGLTFLGWSEDHDQWRYRLASLQIWRKEGGWPDVSEKRMLETLEDWLWPFIGTANKLSDFQRLELKSILASLIPWDKQSSLEELAPSHMQVPSGSYIKLKYFEDGSDPVMEVRLQEVFGWFETPTINGGRTKIKMHLLSPGYRPVQVTQDLQNFWKSTYAEVRKELRARYPKHSWPEDPFVAEAVRGVKKKK